MNGNLCDYFNIHTQHICMRVRFIYFIYVYVYSLLCVCEFSSLYLIFTLYNL